MFLDPLVVPGPLNKPTIEEYSLNDPIKLVIIMYKICGDKSGIVIFVRTLPFGVESILAAS